MDALLTSPLATAAPAKPEALPAVPRKDERRTRERDRENAQRDVEEHKVEEEERSRVSRPTDGAVRLRRARERAREAGGARRSGAGGERAELNDGEEPVVSCSMDIAVGKRDVELRIAGRGGGCWPQDVAGVVDLGSIEPEGDGDRSAGNKVLVADRRARVAETGRLNLAFELVYAFIVEGESTLGCVSRKRGRRGSAVGEVGQGGAGSWVTGDPGNGVGQVSDAGVGVDGWEVAGEARGNRCANGRHQQPLVVRWFHVRVGT